MQQMMDETKQNKLDALRSDANSKLREAEKAWHVFASALPIGSERERAFDVCENVRNAPRVSL
jgi:hypothetical protein